MKIGILSDSHGRAAITRAAVCRLTDAGAHVLIHLGDVETVEVIDALVGADARIVFGNCDWDVPALTDYARSVGLQVDHPMGVLAVDGKRVAYTHGHISRLLTQAVSDGVEYLLHGHSHEIRDERVDATRVINPGALFRASRYTAAVLDPGADALEFLELPRGR